MDTLLLIGNGFDLAHGLPTSYKHFFESLVTKIIERPEDYLDIVKPRAYTVTIEEFHKYTNYHDYKNKFFKLLAFEFSDKKWCDIEALYFKELVNMNNFVDIHELNQHFQRIKEELEKYLTSLDFSIPEHDYFQRILNPPSMGETVILNFNYTKTFEQYIDKGKTQVLNIHGQLNDPDNPIIFGYAASEDQIKEYRKRDSEYMRNIKRTNYNFSSYYSDLLDFLNNTTTGFKVYIFGHSCGESDRLILSEIFNNHYVKYIEISYFNRNGYFDQFVNIQNLMNNELGFNKVVEYPRSLRMPQLNEETAYEELLSSYFQNRRR